jgi:hypothetical protein
MTDALVLVDYIVVGAQLPIRYVYWKADSPFQSY